MRKKFIQESKEGDILVRISQLVEKEEEKVIYYVSLMKIHKLVNNSFNNDNKSYIYELLYFFNKKDNWEMDTKHSIPSLTISSPQVVELCYWKEGPLADLNAEENDYYEFSMSDTGETWENVKKYIDEPFEKVMEQIDKNGFYKLCIDNL
jgi:hypothetical protein